MDGTYLDYNASAPLPPELTQEAVALLHRSTGNPSSTHKAGRETRKLIREATEQVASFLNCSSSQYEIYWTSGASEANSWVFHCLPPGQRIIISAIEHESVRLAAENYQQQRGGTLDICAVDAQGVIDLKHLERLLQTSAALVSVVAANNETGVIQPLELLSELCQKAGVPLHSDCVQLFGKSSLNFNTMPLDLASFSGHKIGAPKGCGFLVARKNEKTETNFALTPAIFGKQQLGLRGGTENAWAIALTGRIALGLEKRELSLPMHLKQWHQEFEAQLTTLLPGTIIHGQGAPRLPNTSYVFLPGLDADLILAALDLDGVWASSGSACSSSTAEPSKTLLAMGCSSQIAKNSVRFSSGHQTKQKDFTKALTTIQNITRRVSS